MKRISKITEKQKVASDDFVEDDELDYLLQGEESLLGARQYFSWDSPISPAPIPQKSTTDIPNLNQELTVNNQSPTKSVPRSGIDDLLPDLDLRGLFDDQKPSPSSAKERSSLSELDLLGVFDDPNIFSSESDHLLASDFDENDDSEPLEHEDSLENDELLSFTPEYSDDNISEEDPEPNWLDLAGEVAEFDNDVSLAFEEVEVEGAVDRAERSLQAAMDVGNVFNLDESEIQIVAMIFENNGWGACRIAVIRELEQNTSVAELDLASGVKGIWLEHYEFYSAQESNYRILSWPTALKLVNSFSGYPSLEEIEQLLIYLHNHWREDKIQKLISRSFNEYLITYLNRVEDGFEYAPEWAIEQESPLVDNFFKPPSTEDIPAINIYDLERAIRNVRRNSMWMNEGLCQ